MQARGTMATPFIAPVTALQVGSYFIEQYYRILHQQPGLVYQFYTDASTVLRVDGAIIETATATMQIHSLVTSLNITGIEIKTAHSLDSWNGGVMVMVTGFLQAKEFGGRRKFVQTFFLAPQEKGYFVLNDILYFLNEEESHQHQASLLPHGNFDSKLSESSPLPDAVSEYMLGEELQTRDFVSTSHVEENLQVDSYTIPNSSHPLSEDIVVEEPRAEVSTDPYSVSMNSVPEPTSGFVEEPVREPVKQTYASILRVPKSQSGPSAASQNSLQKSAAAVGSEWQYPHSFPQHLNPIIPEKSGFEAEEPAIQEEEEEASVYVRNLPLTVSASELEEEFKNFGKIKPDGVVIRTRKDVNVCYAFIEFEDAGSVQNAVKASTVHIAGRQVHIEERRASSTSRGGRRGRGRGRSQSDTSRGGLGYRNFYREGGHDGGDRDLINKPRGNGFRSRGPQQERGVLGKQFSRNGPDQFDATA